MAEKISWTELRRTIAKRAGVSEKEAAAFLAAFNAQLVEALKRDKQVRINGLGTFRLQAVAPRRSVNIASGEEKVYTFDEGKKYEIIINEDGNFEVTGKWINKIFNSTNFGDTESTNFFQRTLENEGVFEELKKMGVKEGDTVKVCDLEFDYYD